MTTQLHCTFFYKWTFEGRNVFSESEILVYSRRTGLAGHSLPSQTSHNRHSLPWTYQTFEYIYLLNFGLWVLSTSLRHDILFLETIPGEFSIILLGFQIWILIAASKHVYKFLVNCFFIPIPPYALTALVLLHLAIYTLLYLATFLLHRSYIRLYISPCFKTCYNHLIASILQASWLSKSSSVLLTTLPSTTPAVVTEYTNSPPTITPRAFSLPLPVFSLESKFFFCTHSHSFKVIKRNKAYWNNLRSAFRPRSLLNNLPRTWRRNFRWLLANATSRLSTIERKDCPVLLCSSR